MKHRQEDVLLMKTSLLLGIMLVMFSLLSSSAAAESRTRPIQLALVTPVQIFPEEDNIRGIRLNLLYGRNAFFTGVDLGLVNHTTSGISKGYQTGMVGIVDEDFLGWQDNFVNVVNNRIEGFQSGFVNYARSVSGVQFGFVNYAGSMYGLQIGLVNIIGEGGAFPVFPIVNWSF